MKIMRATLILSVALASLAFADSNVVSSANVVGYVQSIQQNDLQIIMSPFEGSSLNDMALTNGLGGDSLVNSDNVYLYVPGEGYKNYFFAGDVGDPTFNYKWIDHDTTTVATNIIPPGTAFWYRNRLGTTNEVMFSGDVVLDVSITNTIVEGLQLISFPYSCAADLNSMALTNGLGGDSLVNSDNIYIYVPGVGYKNYFFAGDVGDPAFNYKWIDHDTTTVVTNDIPLDAGFWYRCRKVGGYEWIVPRPYLND